MCITPVGDNEVNLHDFYYELPDELIAQDPLEDRSSSRLMLLNKETGEIEHKVFKDIVNYLNTGDCLVINNTKVIPARLLGVKEDTNAAVEVLLLKRRENDIWETLVKPGKKCKEGITLTINEELSLTILSRTEVGGRIVKFNFKVI